MPQQLPFGTDALLLVGNLKVGKSTLFDGWIGRRRTHLVYPGTGVELGVGRMPGERGLQVVDAPGFYALHERSEDAFVVRDLLLRRRVGRVLLVLDAKTLRRGLVLTQEIAELGIPVVVALNMVDEARQRGLYIDTQTLSRELGVPVVETVATERRGVAALRRALSAAAPLKLGIAWPESLAPARERLLTTLADGPLPPAAAAYLLLAGVPGEQLEVAHRPSVEAAQAVDLTEALGRRAEQLVSRTVRAQPAASGSGWDRLAAWTRQPLTGIPIALAVLVAVYLFVGQLGAGLLVDLIEGGLFGNLVLPVVEGWVARIPWAWTREMLVGDFGLLSVGLTLPLGVVLPVLATFFFALALLVDSGYLPRLSLLLDGLMRRIGLNGRGVLPLVMGFSCVAMALLTARILDTRKQRIIVSLLLVLAVPCAPLLAVMMVVLERISIGATVLVLGLLAAQVYVVGWLADRLLPGQRPDLVIELPPLRPPKLSNALVKSGHKVVWFLREAIPYFMLGTFLLFVLEQLGLTEVLRAGFRPVSEVLLGLPASSADVFLMTVIRREVGAAVLAQQMADGAFDGVQSVVTLVVMTLMVPCINTVLVLFKERGTAVACAVLAFTSGWALLLGALLNAGCRALGVTFQ